MKTSYIYIAIIFFVCSCSNNEKESPNTSTSPSRAVNAELKTVNDLLLDDPKNPTLFLERAKIFQNLGQYDQALLDINAAFKIDDSNVDAYHLQADVYMDNAESKKALNAIEEAARLYPARIPTLLKLSETYYILKQYDNSLLYATKVLNLDPQEAEGYFMLGLGFQAIEDIDKAINSFQTAVEMNPDLLDGWLLLGRLSEEKNSPLAKEYYETATKVSSENISAWHSLAYYYQNHDNIEEAKSIYKKIIALDQEYPDSYINLGILYLDQDSILASKDHFKILTKVSPENYLGHYYLGQINELQENYDMARENYRSANILNPENPRIGEAIKSVSAKQK